jgi:ATP/ADP translocase
MKDAHCRLAYGLAFAGALPFLAATGLVACNWQADRAIPIAMTYGAVIIAFLSGIHWAVFLFRPAECPQNLFVISNVIALVGWFAIALPSPLCFLVQSACFLYLLMIDRSLARADLLPDWFWTLRCWITSIVAVSLIVLAALTA